MARLEHPLCSVLEPAGFGIPPWDTYWPLESRGYGLFPHRLELGLGSCPQPLACPCPTPRLCSLFSQHKGTFPPAGPSTPIHGRWEGLRSSSQKSGQQISGSLSVALTPHPRPKDDNCQLFTLNSPPSQGSWGSIQSRNLPVSHLPPSLGSPSPGRRVR